MKNEPPKSVHRFEDEHPEIWRAFAALAEQCHEQGGPLDEKSRRLVKLGIAVGMRHEGAVHSAVRHALASGIAPEEIRHSAILAITTIGWPSAYAAVTWIDDVLSMKQPSRGGEDTPE